jgi:hypothetical protein
LAAMRVLTDWAVAAIMFPTRPRVEAPIMNHLRPKMSDKRPMRV